MYFIGLVIFLLGSAFAGRFRGIPFTVYNNPAAVVIILFAIVGIIVMTSGFGTFIRGVNALISKKYHITDEDREKAAGLFRMLTKTMIFVSVIMACVGMISVLINLSDTTALAHGLTATFVTPVIALTIAIVFFEPAVYILRRRLPAEEAVIKTYPKKMGDRLVELCVQNGITEEDIMNATGIELKKD